MVRIGLNTLSQLMDVRIEVRSGGTLFRPSDAEGLVLRYHGIRTTPPQYPTHPRGTPLSRGIVVHTNNVRPMRKVTIPGASSISRSGMFLEFAMGWGPPAGVTSTWCAFLRLKACGRSISPPRRGCRPTAMPHQLCNNAVSTRVFGGSINTLAMGRVCRSCPGFRLATPRPADYRV